MNSQHTTDSGGGPRHLAKRASWPALVAVLFSTVMLAGCGGLDSNDSSNDKTKTDAARTTTSGTTTTGQTGTQTGQAGGGGTGGTAPQGTTTTTGPGGGTTFSTASGGGATTSSGGATAATSVTAAGATRRAATRPPSRSPLGAFAGGRFFSPTSPWNTVIEASTIDPRSQEMLSKANRRLAIVEAKATSPGITTGAQGLQRVERENKSGLFINTRAWAPPVFTEAGGVVTPTRCRQRQCGSDAISSLVIPRTANPAPEFDGWYTILDRPRGIAYDFWRARRERDSSISYQFVRRWDLNGPGFLPPTVVSARGSGLPLFAGMITPEEIRTGQINHALAISVPGPAQRKYVQPASRTDGNGRIDSLPEGARIRLRPGARPGKIRGGRNPRNAARAIITALQRYGAIVVDRAAVPTLYAQRNAHWKGIIRGNELQKIKLNQFEVIQLGPLLDDPPLNERETQPRAGQATRTRTQRGQGRL